jgi:ribosomal protein S18 acetylase RimI-like enzyme
LLAYSVGFPTDEKLDRVVAQYAGSPYRLVGFEVDSTLCGCLGFQIVEPGNRVIRHIAVAPDARRKGLGRFMVDWLCTTNGLTRVTAETDRDAVEFYKRCGFRITSLGEIYSGTERFSCELVVKLST